MKVPEGVFAEANDEEEEEEQTLGIKARAVSVGIANSTPRKFYVTTFTESARSTMEGGRLNKYLYQNTTTKLQQLKKCWIRGCSHMMSATKGEGGGSIL